jgi:hypothetical protein
MAYEQKPNSGSLFKNDRKEKDTHPDLTGSLQVQYACAKCKHVGLLDFWLSAWKKTSAKGNFFSLSLKAKDGAASKPKSEPSAFDLDDSIPY